MGGGGGGREQNIDGGGMRMRGWGGFSAFSVDRTEVGVDYKMEVLQELAAKDVCVHRQVTG